jgi:CelD/BcsL family acetyltransferase involved in cellulose biosynthesis
MDFDATNTAELTSLMSDGVRISMGATDAAASRTTPDATSLRIRVAAEPRAPDEAAWRLLTQCGDPEQAFLTRSWFSSWEAAYLPLDRWRGPVTWLVARSDDKRCWGVIPIARQAFPGVEFASLAGYYFPFRGLPLPSDESRLLDVCDAVVAYLHDTRRFSPWRIGPIVRNHPTVVALTQAFRRLGWTVLERPAGETHAVALEDDFDAYLRRVGASLIKKTAYFERRLRKQGDVSIARLEFSRETTAVQLDELADLERRSWVATDRDGVVKFADRRSRTFWEALLADPALNALVSIWAVRCNDRIVSYSLNVDSGLTRYTLANGYDEAFSIHSPGTILAYHVFKDATERGLRKLEWGQGDSGYKRRWGAVPNLPLSDLIIVAPGAIRRVALRFFAPRMGFAEMV